MAAPIVFISKNRILAGKLAEFESSYAQSVGLIGSMKPRTALFAAYVDETRTEVRVVHAFPDAAALALHFEGSEERTESASRLVVPTGFELLGQALPAAIEQLRREADAAGVALDILVQPVGGFLRAPA